MSLGFLGTAIRLDAGRSRGSPLASTKKERGLKLQVEADDTTDDPAFFTLLDPDGNPILVDQHVPKPKR